MKKLFLIIAVSLIVSDLHSQTYDFELSDLEGNSVKLSSLLQKGPVLMQFWALWCVPCKEEMRIINELYKKYQDSGFVYVALNEDSPKSSAKVKSYIESKSYKFLVLLDSDLKIFETYGGQNLPFMVFLNKKGDVVKTYTGYISGDESKLEEDIIKQIKESK